MSVFRLLSFVFFFLWGGGVWVGLVPAHWLVGWLVGLVGLVGWGCGSFFLWGGGMAPDLIS